MNENELIAQLHFLIKCLKAEMPEYAAYGLPDDVEQSFNLYRALCNGREISPH